jgi:hypothetical protein
VRTNVVTATIVWALTIAGATAADAPRTAGFDTDDGLTGWTVKGAVSIDRSRSRSGGAMKVAPGGSAVWKLRDTEGAATVDLWVYEDMTVPADPKVRRVGPRWGLLGAGGRALVVGAIYAPYLAGQETYAASDYGGQTWFNVSYLGECRRKAGWHRWTFTMDPAKGLAIAMDGKDVNAAQRRFNWNATQLTGVVAVAIYGEADPAAPGGQTIWVDDVTATLGGAMTAKPTPPPPAPPVVPEADPKADHPVALAPAVAGKHPRLLLAAEDIPRLRTFARSDAAKDMWKGMMAYLPVCKAPSHTNFLTDATDGQRQGLWRMPTAALHYVLTGEKASLDATVGFLKKLLDLPHWEEGEELDSGMSAANIMIGAALAYDWAYADLEPAFREAVRKKLIYHARAMYYGGHLMGNKAATAYWQQDPQNNHRWHRDAGLALCALAAAEGKPEEQWILQKTAEELKFVADWLPADGTSHEGSSYLIFGGTHLTLPMDAADRCLGTKYLGLPFFRNVPLYRLHLLTPGMKDAFHFGDSGGLGGYNNFLYACTARHRLADEQAGLLRMNRLNPDAFEFTWLSLVWQDPTLDGGSMDKLPKVGFYPDLGLALLRDGWDANDSGAMFKCGPYGGRKLNEYRNTHEFHYLNVAHDDPDVNSFLLHARGRLLAETCRYSTKKLTANHNTILIGGKGQLGEGEGWTQPLKGKYQDMTKLGVVTTWKDTGDVVLVEGEGAGAYPDLSRFRRTFVWVKGAYVLVLDDIRAGDGKDVELTWLLQGKRLAPAAAPAETPAAGQAAGRYVLAKDAARCELQVVSDVPLAPTIAASTADDHGKPLGWQQLQLRGKAGRFRLASVYDVWARGGAGVKLAVDAPSDTATVTVTAGGKAAVADAWTWRAPTDAATPSQITARRGDKTLVEVGPKDRAR